MISYLQSFLAREEVLIIYIRTEINCMSFWIRKSSPSSFSSVQFSRSVVSDFVTPWIAACQASLSITSSRSNSPTASETDAWSLGGFLFGQYSQPSLYFYLFFFFKHQKCILFHCGGQKSKFKQWAGRFFQTLQGRIHPGPSLLALGAPWCFVDTAPPSLLCCLSASPLVFSTVYLL